MRLLCMGAGSMVSAIVPQFKDLNKDLQVFTYTPSKTRAKELAIKVNGTLLSSYEEIQKLEFDWLILGFKPQNLDDQLSKLIKSLCFKNPKLFVISLLAGIRLTKLQDCFEHSHIARVMPNTPSLIAQGANLLSALNLESKDYGLLQRLMGGIGELVECEESLLEIATPFSGSGPAYFYYLTEILTSLLIEKGMDIKSAKLLCQQTFIGAAKLLEVSELSAGELKQQVTSKKGVTDAVLNELHNLGIEKIFTSAINKGLKRSSELESAAKD